LSSVFLGVFLMALSGGMGRVELANDLSAFTEFQRMGGKKNMTKLIKAGGGTGGNPAHHGSGCSSKTNLLVAKQDLF
jgi:hypothetical protein